MSDQDEHECYICMNPCEERSPCECASFVHLECLCAFLKLSRHSHCTICHRLYLFPRKKRYPTKAQLTILGGLALFSTYLTGGYLGQVFFYYIGLFKSLPDGTFWTKEHFFAAWMMLSIFGCIFIIIRLYRMCTI